MAFLSTLSLRRATRSKTHDRHKTPISIHALLAESDESRQPSERPTRDFYPRSPCGERLGRITSVSSGLNFYPRSPCGERLISIALLILLTRFLSTLSLRRATGQCFAHYITNNISIHALLAESDYQGQAGYRRLSEFLSTLSLRRATCFSVPYRLKVAISIHALLAESDANQTNLPG